MSSKRKRTVLSIHDIRCTVPVFVCDAVGYSVRHWVEVCQRDTVTLLIRGKRPIQLILWEYDPWALKCFAINRNYLMLLRMRCFVYT